MVKRRIAARLVVCLVSAMTCQLQAGLYEDGLKEYKAGNYKAALPLFLKAAEQGHAKAQVNLGIMYGFGDGVPQDFAEALKWHRKAAEQGDAEAQGWLGGMYRDGRGVPKNGAESVKWYLKAVEQGDANAQSNLGRIYRWGAGVPKDYVEAYKLFSLAASHHPPGEDRDDAVKARDDVAKLMTPAQIAEAERRAREWKRKRKR